MALIKLLRVVLREPVDLPGEAPGVYPSPNNIIEAHPKMGRQAYELFLDGGFVVVRHPKSGLEETIPITGNVKQFTRHTDELEAKLIASRKGQTPSQART